MMATLIAYFGWVACTEEKFGACSVDNFMDISHLMGNPPLNKLYAIMLTVYSATKQAEARAYYNRLSTFVSPLVNNFLFFAACVAMIAGPGIGYYDTYFNLDMHMTFTTTFTVAECIYVYTLCYLMNKHHE